MLLWSMVHRHALRLPPDPNVLPARFERAPLSGEPVAKPLLDNTELRQCRRQWHGSDVMTRTRLQELSDTACGRVGAGFS